MLGIGLVEKASLDIQVRISRGYKHSHAVLSGEELEGLYRAGGPGSAVSESPVSPTATLNHVHQPSWVLYSSQPEYHCECRLASKFVEFSEGPALPPIS